MTFRHPLLPALLLLLSAAAAAPAADAQTLPCAPCAGVRVTDAAAASGTADALAAAAARTGTDLTTGDLTLVVAWTVDLAPLAGNAAATAETAGAVGAAARALREAGADPWITLRFTTPAPLLDHTAALDAEIAAASRLARAAGGAWYQLAWEPRATEVHGSTSTAPTPADDAYLLKRAAVAVSGAAAEARVVSRALPADPAVLEALYARELAGYLEAVAVRPADDEALAAFAGALATLDPGRPLVVDALPYPAAPALALPRAARATVAGAGLVLFDAGPAAADADRLAPLAVLAREHAGDLSYDPYSSPAAGGWAFVRGEDLGLRIIVETETAGGAPVDEAVVSLPDPQLREPQRVDPASGEALPLAGVRRSADGLEVRVADPGAAFVLRLARVGVEELGEVAGVAEEVTVEDVRQMPVEEILRRLQANEDAQARRLEHYSATNTTSLRFGVGAGAQGSFEATFQGAFFFHPEQGVDWAWETLYVNGVRWRGKSIPEIPLVQPEKAAALPGDITFDKTYRYRLRGTDVVDGRQAWVVEFEPAVPVETADAEGAEAGDAPSLYRGTVWVDRGEYVRLRTRAVQLGLTGDVLSNEETLEYRPVTAGGATAAWEDDDVFVLPLRIVAQQLLSVLNATTLVERETRFTDLRINGPGFAERRAEVMASDVTMVRDTERGLRYLVKVEDGGGERVVKQGYDTSKWFLVGGAFWDDSLDYPLPLAGINYLDLDWRWDWRRPFGGKRDAGATDTGEADAAPAADRLGGGRQLNVFFAGALLTVNLSQPRLFDSRFDFGGDVFGLAVPLSDSVYRDGEEIVEEEVEARTTSAALKIGHPLGDFGKLSLQYRARHQDYGSTDDTGEGFAVPSDHVEHAFRLSGRYVRAGYSLNGQVGYSLRSEWEPWGPPGNPEFSPDHEDFTYWNLGLSKNWYLSRFQKIGAEVGYVDGDDLDRFSKYGFGFFGDTRVHGYRSNRVRAERAFVARASYGFEIGQLLRLDAQADTAWATDEASGLEDELLAGVGLAGTFVGPWQTVVNLDVGTPVAGPDDGVVVYVVFLKLFR